MADEEQQMSQAGIKANVFDFDQFNADLTSSSGCALCEGPCMCQGNSTCSLVLSNLMLPFLLDASTCSVELSNRSSDEWRNYLVEVTKEFDALPASTKNSAGMVPRTALLHSASSFEIQVSTWEPNPLEFHEGSPPTERKIQSAEALASELQRYEDSVQEPFVCIITVFKNASTTGNSFGILRGPGPQTFVVDTHSRVDHDGGNYTKIVATPAPKKQPPQKAPVPKKQFHAWNCRTKFGYVCF